MRKEPFQNFPHHIAQGLLPASRAEFAAGGPPSTPSRKELRQAITDGITELRQITFNSTWLRGDINGQDIVRNTPAADAITQKTSQGESLKQLTFHLLNNQGYGEYLRQNTFVAGFSAEKTTKVIAIKGPNPRTGQETLLGILQYDFTQVTDPRNASLNVPISNSHRISFTFLDKDFPGSRCVVGKLDYIVDGATRPNGQYTFNIDLRPKGIDPDSRIRISAFNANEMIFINFAQWQQEDPNFASPQTEAELVKGLQRAREILAGQNIIDNFEAQQMMNAYLKKKSSNNP